MAPKRKLSGTVAARASKRKLATDSSISSITGVIDGIDAARASPAPIVKDEVEQAGLVTAKLPSRSKVKATLDAEDISEPGEEENEEILQAAISRPPPVNSSYLPLPWKGRLGYACLNTYLRYSNPPVFSSRTCRIASILEHRHPLQDPTQPEHSTKNRPDKTKPANVSLGQKWVEELGLANARDVIKTLRWNNKYGIKFMRLSSEMFPFASHLEYGYNLSFAADILEEVGKVVAELGHRVSTHPGQFTQLGSPRKEVVENAIRDLNYHNEMLTRLKLPEQQDRDAVMILHMGGTFGSKEETIDRFRVNYTTIPEGVKKRLVLENDDVSWHVHDLLPICEELNIPMVLDFHHHNILFDAAKVREGTQDIIALFPRIKATWTRKNITQKMHYSEQTPPAITPMKRRKHSPRVATLPPCADDMDLMVEAKDKEQAVFELMRAFKLPGYDLFNDIIPHTRSDENAKVSGRKKKTEDEVLTEMLADDVVGMGGADRRVYWPPGMEEWLRPKKREVKPKADETGSQKAKPTQKAKSLPKAEVEADDNSAVEEALNAKAPIKHPRGINGANVALIQPTAGMRPKTKSKVPLPTLNGADEAKPPSSKAPKVNKIVEAPLDSLTRRSKRASRVSYVDQ